MLKVGLNGTVCWAELVCDASRQLTDGGKAFLQAQLLFEIPYSRQIGEEADGALRLSLWIDQRRHADAFREHRH